MKKGFPVSVFLFMFALTSHSQTEFSAFTQSLIHEAEKARVLPGSARVKLSSDMTRLYQLSSVSKSPRAAGLLQVEPGIDEAALAGLGVRVNAKIGNIWTASIPVDGLAGLEGVDGLKYVELRTPRSVRLDSARANTGAELVLAGTGLPQAYTGNGVVIGVLDGGFDFTHPTFFDGTGSTLRISRVWDMGNDTGPAPAPYTYGTEYATPTAILNARQDAANGTHGTHVAGIAAGSGALTSNRYRGFAPDAELILINVFPNGSEADGIKYVFDYAAGVGKPAVINMSLGSHIGPHDGTSLTDMAFDNLAGNGKILVGAAGNEGATPLHLSGSISTGDTVRTAVLFEGDTPTGSGFVDCWGSAGSDFSLSVFVIETASQQIVSQSVFYPASGATVQTGEWTFNGGQDTVRYQVNRVASNPNNQRPDILARLSNGSGQHHVGLAFTSASTTLHVWNHSQGNGAPLTDLGIAGMVSGNTDYTVGEVGGTSKSIIAVGAYTSKTNWVDTTGGGRTYNETLGAIATFSSRGPTSDGRIKPEIGAPGTAVVSSFSSFSNQAQALYVQNVVFGSKTYSYGVEQGTSMASPAAAGMIALLLQKNPALNKADLMTIFQATARQDQGTGAIPPGGNNTWGYGKFDAHAAIMHQVTSVAEDRPGQVWSYELLRNYPNPFNPSTTISFLLPVENVVSLKVYDLLGRTVATLVNGRREAGRHVVTFDAAGLSSGVYVYRLEAGSFRQSHRMMLLR